ncbi:MAG: DUF5131 family protein [Gammaproteobacteria bacterium]|nr:DUF5131 family protein [Gammaproteobacteria bacterium]
MSDKTGTARDKATWNPKTRYDQPLRWRRPRMIFVNSMADLFHESVPDAFIDQVFAVMALAPQHTFQVLTKRVERMRDWFAPGYDNREHAVGQTMREIAASRGGDDAGLPEWPLANVWLGVSAEDQETADARIPVLLETPAAVRWVSLEPLLGPVDLERILWPHKGGHRVDVLRGGYWNKEGVLALGPSAGLGTPKGGFTNHSDFPSCLDWVVVGGESGPGARVFRAEWAREILRQCRAANVPFFMKQMGAAFNDGRFTLRLRHRAGADMAEWPEDLRVREYPLQMNDTMRRMARLTDSERREILSNARIKGRLHVPD